MAKGKSPKRKAAGRAKRAGAKRTQALAGPQLGQQVHYVAKVWEISGTEADPHHEGYFVDLVRRDSDGKHDARIHTAQLIPDTTGGWTFEEDPNKVQWHRRMAAAPHGGDPEFPLVPQFIDRHQRFAHQVELEAEARFKKSVGAKDKSWNTADEAVKGEFRLRAREALQKKKREKA